MAKYAKNNMGQTQAAEKAQENDLYVISDYLKNLKFSTRVMGVDEADVWKKIEKLCELYDEALLAEREKNKKLTKQLNACLLRLKNLLPPKEEKETN